MRYRRSHRQSVKYLLAAGTLLALAGMFINPRDLLSAKAPKDACQQVIQPQKVLSREELSQLLTIPERDRKSRVRAIVKEPYCKLPNLEIRSGTTAQRDAYPLAFDPQTWLIILYEGDEYAGYSFSFRQ
ncbi:hypothetical protein [Phormidesmis sp. 146-33]